MSWNASGVIEGRKDELWQDAIAFSPPEESMSDEVKAQVDFLRSTISEAFSAGVLEGKYSVSANGHDDPSYDGNRKSFSVSFSATT